ncbi:MAG: TetR/AcrR family transcriptional regulator [Burkholderiaceae bacterium]
MMISTVTSIRPRVGRVARAEQRKDTRALLVRCGIELFTERGFQATGIDEIRARVNVPKGSFYHFFESKHAFGTAVVDSYAAYFERKLKRHFDDDSLSPLERLRSFVEDAKGGMQKFNFQRGCLIGNLGQELGGIDDRFRDQLERVLQSWQRLTAACLKAAVDAKELSSRTDCDALAEFFWIGWEGAILRAKLTRNNEPLDRFFNMFLSTASAVD